MPRFLDSKDVPALGLGRDEGELAEDYEYLRSVQSRNGIAYAVADVHLARHVFERAPEMFRAELALPALSKIGDIGIAKAHQTLVIGSADTETAQLLNIALNAPTAEAHCVVTDTSGVAIYIGDIIYRGDCVKLDINLLPNVAGDQADDGSA